MRATIHTFLAILLSVAANAAATADDTVKISAAATDQNGFLIHTVISPFQAGPTQIRVLLPEPLAPQLRYPVVYVLPVEANSEHRYGDGLLEVKRQKLTESHRVVFVAPTFSQLPWYADHPTDPKVRQESYLLRVVVPFVDDTYQTLAERRGRFLLGFSKSGWGAWTLLLRHPNVFERAAAWDAPLDMHELGQYGTGPIFGTQENFRRYCVADLLRARTLDLSSRARLVLLGWGGFRSDTEATHSLLDKLEIPHIYQNSRQFKHNWHSGWVSDSVKLLLSEAPP